MAIVVRPFGGKCADSRTRMHARDHLLMSSMIIQPYGCSTVQYSTLQYEQQRAARGTAEISSIVLSIYFLFLPPQLCYTKLNP